MEIVAEESKEVQIQGKIFHSGARVYNLPSYYLFIYFSFLGNHNRLTIYSSFDIIHCSTGVEAKGGGRLRTESLDLGAAHFSLDKPIEVCHYCS